MSDIDYNNSEYDESINYLIPKFNSSPVYEMEQFNPVTLNIIQKQGDDEYNLTSEQEIVEESSEQDIEQIKEVTQYSEKNISTLALGKNKEKPYKKGLQNDGIQFQVRELAIGKQQDQVYYAQDNQVSLGNLQNYIQNEEILSNFEIFSCSCSDQKVLYELNAEQEGNLKNQKQRKLKLSTKQIKQNKNSIINQKKLTKEPKQTTKKKATKVSKKAIKKEKKQTEKKQKEPKQKKKYVNQSKNYPGFFKRYIYKLASQFGKNWLHDNYPTIYETTISQDTTLDDINQLMSIEPLKQKFIQSIENDDLLFYILESDKLLSIQSYFEALCAYHQQLITTGIIKNQTISKKKKQKIGKN